jgi:hypothetical protein
MSWPVPLEQATLPHHLETMSEKFQPVNCCFAAPSLPPAMS